MKKTSCLACKGTHRRPAYVDPLPEVRFYAPIDTPGQPTLKGHRLGAEMLASMVYDWDDGMAEVMKMYDLTRAEMLVVCWWAGQYGPKKYRKAWKEWALAAHAHLWYSCIRIDDPPSKGIREGIQTSKAGA